MTVSYLKCLMTVFLLALVGGCQYTYRPTVRSDFESDTVPKFSSNNDISLQNAQISPEDYVFGQIVTNRQECTNVVVATAKRELSNRGLRVVENSARVMKLSIVSFKQAGGGFEIAKQAELEVQTGDGYSAKYTGSSSSYGASVIQRQMDYALSECVVEMLKDPKIVAYLTK
jgi:hypothetical protein